MILAHTLLVIAKDSNHAIRFIVGRELFEQRSILRGALIELLLEGNRSIVRSEYFGSEALHIRSQMLVDARCL